MPPDWQLHDQKCCGIISEIDRDKIEKPPKLRQVLTPYSNGSPKVALTARGSINVEDSTSKGWL